VSPRHRGDSIEGPVLGCARAEYEIVVDSGDRLVDNDIPLITEPTRHKQHPRLATCRDDLAGMLAGADHDSLTRRQYIAPRGIGQLLGETPR
jgi:hypothetical protein